MPGQVQEFLAARRGGRRQQGPPTLADLRQQVAELEAESRAVGAPAIDEDKPGLFTKIIDVLSRPNYATAGFVEELLNGKSVTAGAARALNEILSGAGPFQGQKRAFGEVLEGQGVGTTTLADVFPALEETWIGNLGSRGAAGLALDIATDPLTYMTFGASGGLRVTTSKGVRYLNKAGKEARHKLWLKQVENVRPLLKDADDISVARTMDRAVSATDAAFEKLYTRGDDIAPELIEPGGAKLFGAKIPGSDKLGVPLKKAMEMLPESIATPAIEGAEQMHRGMARMLNGLFSPDGVLANLPEPIRSRATRLTNSMFRSSVAHRSHLLGQVDPLEGAYRKLEKADPKIGERWHDVREEVLPRSAITDPVEMELFDRTMALYDSMGATAIKHGVLDETSFLPNYIYHVYKNPEALAQYHPRHLGMSKPGTAARFEKERKFETLRFAEAESERLHELSLQLLSRAEAKRLYPKLEPEYDVFKNMKSYVNAHSHALARKAWREEMLAQFGKSLDEFDFEPLYREAADVVDAGKLPDPDKIPAQRVIKEGDVEKSLLKAFGPDGAQYVAVKSKLTSDELVYLPKAIADSMESLNSSVFNTKDYKEFGRLLRGFDWLNNNFKWGVYTVWPASATRDAYSNIFLSALRIGWAAVDPRRHINTVEMMAGRNLGKQFADSGFTLGELRKMSKTMGVWVPGTVFVEQTGGFHLGHLRGALTEKRALIENEARVLLWMEEIARGADPRTAADTVGQFLFNYGEVSRPERELFRRMIPFYTFTRKNVELQWKALRSNPGLVVNQLKPFRGLSSENEEMISFEGEAAKIRLDRDGRTIHMLTGIDPPLRNMDNLWAGGVGPSGRRWMGMMTPLIKTPIEMVANRDFFTGRDLTRVRGDSLGRLIEATNTPQGIKDWLGYRKDFDQAGRPRYDFNGSLYALLVRSWMFSRLVSTSDRAFREYSSDPTIARALLDFTTGIRDKTINLDEQQALKLRRRIQELEESLVRRGARQQFTRSYTRPGGQLQ